MGAAQGRSTPAAGIEIVYAGLRDRLDALTLPALVVWGGRDRVVSPRYAEQLRDALPDGRCSCSRTPGTCRCARSRNRWRAPCWISSDRQLTRPAPG